MSDDRGSARHDHPIPGRQSLWLLTAGPAIWSLYFLSSYVFAAVWCEKMVPTWGSFATVRIVIGSLSAIAFLAIGYVFWIGYRRHTFGEASVPHDFDSPADQHRFLGYATLLLAGLSMLATIYCATTVVFMETCQ